MSITVSAGDIASIMASLTVMYGIWRTNRKVDENTKLTEVIHKATNGLSARNEAIARKLGIEEGKAKEKANPS